MRFKTSAIRWFIWTKLAVLTMPTLSLGMSPQSFMSFDEISLVLFITKQGHHQKQFTLEGDESAAVFSIGKSPDKINQDFIAFNPEDSILLVADGVGGHPFGDLASRLYGEWLFKFTETILKGKRFQFSTMEELRDTVNFMIENSTELLGRFTAITQTLIELHWEYTDLDIIMAILESRLPQSGISHFQFLRQRIHFNELSYNVRHIMHAQLVEAYNGYFNMMSLTKEEHEHVFDEMEDIIYNQNSGISAKLDMLDSLCQKLKTDHRSELPLMDRGALKSYVTHIKRPSTTVNMAFQVTIGDLLKPFVVNVSLGDSLSFKFDPDQEILIPMSLPKGSPLGHTGPYAILPLTAESNDPSIDLVYKNSTQFILDHLTGIPDEGTYEREVLDHSNILDTHAMTPASRSISIDPINPDNPTVVIICSDGITDPIRNKSYLEHIINNAFEAHGYASRDLLSFLTNRLMLKIFDATNPFAKYRYDDKSLGIMIFNGQFGSTTPSSIQKAA